MSQPRRTCAILVAAASISIAAPGFATPRSSAPQPFTAAQPESYADAKRQVDKQYLDSFEELTKWCHAEKAFQQRDAISETILLLDSENKRARKYLRWTYDRKEKEWTRRRPYKLPKEGEPEVVAEALRERTRLVNGFVSDRLEALESSGKSLPPKQRSDELEFILQIAPDHAGLRAELGYVQMERDGETIWITRLAVNSLNERKVIAQKLAEMRGQIPEPKAIEALAPEPELPVTFTASLGNERVRVVGDVDDDEARRATQIGYLAWDFLPFLLGGELALLPEFTYYMITPENKLPFIQSYPGISADNQLAFPILHAAWMPESYRLGCWGKAAKYRLDMAMKQTTQMYTQYVYGLMSSRGWIVEGAGLYANQLIMGTRYNYTVTKTIYDDPTKPNADREMPDATTDWLELAGEILADARPALLAKTMGKNSSQLTVDDLVLSYAMVKYLREAHGAEALSKIMKQIGEGEAGSVVVLETFFDAKIPEIQENLRKWIEEVGGNDFEQAG